MNKLIKNSLKLSVVFIVVLFLVQGLTNTIKALKIGNSIMVVNPSTDFAGGSGTISDPYIISNAIEFDNLRKYSDPMYINTYFALSNDIDLANLISNTLGYGSEGWLPIGDNTNAFTGNFDGRGYTISGFFINRPNLAGTGLFGVIKDASISDINIIASNPIVGETSTGGAIGSGFNSLVDNVSFEGLIIGNNYVGGILGLSENTSTINTKFKGSISGNSNIGGIVGYFNGDNQIISTNRALVDINPLENAFNIGGLVGLYAAENSRVENSYAQGSIIGNSSNGIIGGLVGTINNTTSQIIDSYSDVHIKGSFNLGGIIGSELTVLLSNVYAVGHVEPFDNSSDLTSIGGIVGDTSGPGRLTILNSFFDSATTKQSFAAGGYDNNLNPDDWPETIKNTTDMKSSALYTSSSWSINTNSSTWKINENLGYPLLDAFVYELSFDLNGAAGQLNTQYLYDYHLPFPVSQPSLPGYTFLGWNNTSDGLGAYFDLATLNISQDTNLYAIWKINSKYNLIYNGNGATKGAVPIDMNSPYDAGSIVTVLGRNDLVNENNTFVGWNTMPDGSGTLLQEGSTFNINQNTILYAQWKKNVLINNNEKIVKTGTTMPLGYLSLFITSSFLYLVNKRRNINKLRA